MNLPPSHTCRWLERFLAGEITVAEFEARMYASPGLEEELGAANHFDLLAFDYRQPDAAHVLARLVTAIYERRRPGSLLRDRAWRLACGLAGGSIHFHAAVHALANLWYRGEEWVGTDFAGISSELDNVPSPDEYPLWEPGALARHLDGWKGHEAALAKAAVEAARELLLREFPDWPCPAQSPLAHAP